MLQKHSDVSFNYVLWYFTLPNVFILLLVFVSIIYVVERKKKYKKCG